MAALKSFRNAEIWIPACAGMTMNKGFFEFFKDRFGGGFRGQSPCYGCFFLIKYGIKGRLKRI